jgi:peptidoglycan-associated lipoprotein
MKSRGFLYIPVVLLLSMLVLWGCPKKAEVTTAPEAPVEAAPAEPVKEEPAVEEPTIEQPTEPVAEEPQPEVAPQVEAIEEPAEPVAVGLQPVYFDFDRSFIREDARAVMKANADWLKANPGVKVRIEGNCDERGTREYNQALGQRRAASAKKYLTDLGVSAKRISLISYGKEKPVCTASNEECWQKNRRGDFVEAGK